MNILLKQSKNGILSQLGLSDTYFKKQVPSHDYRLISKKAHHHSDFELHMVVKGCHTYDIDGKEVTLTQGEYLLICPLTTHRFVCADEQTQRYSLTFSIDFPISCRYRQGPLSDRMLDRLQFSVEEAEHKYEGSEVLLEGAVAEMILTILRQVGYKERAIPSSCEEGNTTLALAKRYIEDNITRAPSVAAVAAYCYLSAKQLTRIFYAHTALSPAEYITRVRLQYIQKALTDSTLSLSEISERFSFSSEYYFSSYIKKHLGMPPSEYRKRMGK